MNKRLLKIGLITTCSAILLFAGCRQLSAQVRDTHNDIPSPVKTATNMVSLQHVPPKSIAKTSSKPSNPIVLHHTSISGMQVNYAEVNMHDSTISVQPVVANRRFGTVASLNTMARAAGAVLAINGTYFNSGSNDYPAGALEVNGQFINDEKGTLLGIGRNGNLLMTRAQESLWLYVKDKSNPNLRLWPWYLNQPGTAGLRISVLTSWYGGSTSDPLASELIVENNHIKAIDKGRSPIPTNGFDIELGNSSNNRRILSGIHIGDTVQFRVEVDSLGNTPIPFSEFPYAVGGGPMLVHQSRINLNPKLEGFRDPNVLASRTKRSFVGIQSNGDLVIGTISIATLSQEADIAHRLGLKEAMNLDGGSSTGLFYRGQYIVKPGRLLESALVVRQSLHH